MTASSTAPGSPVIVASRDGGRQVRRASAPRSRGRRSRRGPSGPAPGARGGRGRRPRRPGRPGGPARRRWPSAAAPPRRCAGRGGPAPARCRAGPRPRSRRRRPARRPGVATTMAGRVVDLGQHAVAAGGPRPGPAGNARPSSSAVRASPSDRRPQAAVAALARRPRPSSTVPHQRQAGGGGRTGQRQRPGARPRSAPGCGSARRPGTAAYPRARRLDQHRPDASAPRGSRRAPGSGIRAPRACGSRLEVVVGGPGDGHRDPLAQHRAGRGELAGPAGAQQVLRLDGAGEAADERARPARARRGAAASRGRGGTARAARRAGRRRRPRSRPGRGRAPARTPAARVPTTMRRAPRLTGEEVAVAARRARRPAVSATWWPCAQHRGRARGRPGRRPCRRARRPARRARPRRTPPRPRAPAACGQSVAGRPHPRRRAGRRPSARWREERRRPCSWPRQAAPRRARASNGAGAGAAGAGSFSVVACRGGTASRSTSERVPA